MCMPHVLQTGLGLNQPFTAAEIVGGTSMLRRGSATLGFLSVTALRAAALLVAKLCIAALFN